MSKQLQLCMVDRHAWPVMVVLGFHLKKSATSVEVSRTDAGAALTRNSVQAGAVLYKHACWQAQAACLFAVCPGAVAEDYA